jgi:hypothetical protein
MWRRCRILYSTTGCTMIKLINQDIKFSHFCESKSSFKMNINSFMCNKRMENVERFSNSTWNYFSRVQCTIHLTSLLYFAHVRTFYILLSIFLGSSLLFFFYCFSQSARVAEMCIVCDDKRASSCMWYEPFT